MYFSVEFIPYIRHYSLKKIVFKKIHRFFFFLINLFGFVFHSFILISQILKWENFLNDENLIAFLRILIILRSLRIFTLLNMFPDFKNIFSTIENMKEVFGSLISSLFSFFFVFSTISIFLFGGRITKDEYTKISNIPDEYSHINFNDYGSSFLLCFCLMIFNDMNILIDYICGYYDLLIKPYFVIFYFLSILIILNIFQTFVLDMYLNVKKTKLKVKRQIIE